MELEPAPGSQELEKALADPNVHAIVDGLIRLKGNAHFRTIAKFLKDNKRYDATKLRALKMNSGARPDASGNYPRMATITELISNIEILYAQTQEMIGYWRGAIVELISERLVNKRCQPGECYGNQLFVDGRKRLSKQIDVAVLSEKRRQIEAYTCKLNRDNLEIDDCDNLASLAKEAEERDYKTHVGVICFASNAFIELKIGECINNTNISIPFKAYGLDNFFELERNPF